jgi:acetate kinase
MGTRSGDLDPGVLVYLMREKKFDAAMLEELVDHRSGLLGISGVGSDMRRLHEAASSNADARLAIAMFCYSVRKQVAAMIAALGGVDLLVFTGGIGENDVEARAAICGGLSWLGVSLDEARNRSAENPISESGIALCGARPPSQEDEQIARHTWGGCDVPLTTGVIGSPCIGRDAENNRKRHPSRNLRLLEPQRLSFLAHQQFTDL